MTSLNLIDIFLRLQQQNMQMKSLGSRSKLGRMAESNMPPSSAKKVTDTNSCQQLHKQAKEKGKWVICL